MDWADTEIFKGKCFTDSLKGEYNILSWVLNKDFGFHVCMSLRDECFRVLHWVKRVYFIEIPPIIWTTYDTYINNMNQVENVKFQSNICIGYHLVTGGDIPPMFYRADPHIPHPSIIKMMLIIVSFF